MDVRLIQSDKCTLLFDDTTDGASNCDNDDENILSLIKAKKVEEVFAEMKGADFDSPLIAEVYQWNKKLEQINVKFNVDKLPSHLKDILSLSLKTQNIPPKENHTDTPVIEQLGKSGYSLYLCVCRVLKFIGDVFSSLMRFINGKAIYRKKDFWFIFEDCSYKAVGITALVSFLVGLILAFVGALQLKAFGAGIYVASMVALGMTRIMAAIMTGIIMAGRTGSSYAATLGTMQVNEEIDALKTLGVKVTDYLVVPRLVSLVTTIPFLTLLADLLGILGGAVVGVCFLNLSSSAYFDYSIKALDLTNILVGLLHSIIYGIIISICGCYAGLNAGRDADAVGKATTSAVVLSLVWMIVATGILTVLLEVIGI